jgi:purine-cytosine permease-like protein
MGSKIFVEFIGIGLGSGLANNPTWAAGFGNGGVGGLITAAYQPLGRFGDFCAIILGLGVAANMIPGNYSAAFCIQLLAPQTQALPRVFWNTIATIVYIVCAIAGRNQLLTIFLNFLPLIGYWTIIWITITLEEQVIFRRTRGYVWSDWDQPSKLPIGIAAFSSFLVGWAGAILCMSQAYYVGPIAKMVPADMGLPVAAAWTAIVYPGFRVKSHTRVLMLFNRLMLSSGWS